LLEKKSPEYDPQAAIPLLLQSAQQDYEWAQYRLGKIFLTGNPVERDIEYGLRWLREAETQNNQYAQILLARTFLNFVKYHTNQGTLGMRAPTSLSLI
jgi:TPR repeat protein